MSMKNTVFITGTDTDIGKTFVSCLLLKYFNSQGLKTIGLKPVASGCYRNQKGELRNDDALKLKNNSSLKIPYSIINPIRFEKPIAPHIAADQMGITLSKQLVTQTIHHSISVCDSADFKLIEGVGGWSVPLSYSELLSDVVIDLNIPVILVVGIKLGCLNHALLTYQNIKSKNVPILGWVANGVDPSVLYQEDNINTLKNWISAPCLGVVAYGGEFIEYINTELLRSIFI